MRLWDTLTEPWRICLTLAWERYRGGSLPIAAVMVDADGAVVARGRNRLRDAVQQGDNEPNALHAHPLAHAEVNALLAFPFGERSAAGCTLLTATEPCPLCVGALRMCGVKRSVYASRDPWAGCSAMFETVPYLRGGGTEVASLAGSPLETVLVALQIDAHLRLERPDEKHRRFLDVWREVLPVGVAAGEQLFASDALSTSARSGAEVREAVAVIEQAVAGVSSGQSAQVPLAYAASTRAASTSAAREAATPAHSSRLPS